MKNLLKKLAAASLFLFLTNVALADEVAPTKASANTSTQTEIEDPDLKLSIDDLKKKYPIDWLEKKYGKVTDSNCLVVDDEPESGESVIREVSTWPCGSVCKKYPQQKQCPKMCSEVEPKNLVCTFFKGFYEKNSKGVEFFIEKPVAQFSDFSDSEVKSVFIHYNPSNSCDKTEKDCGRMKEIIVISFIHFLTSESLSNTDIKLKNFVFSKKIVGHIFVLEKSKVSFSDGCGFFSKFSLKDLAPEDKLNSFCSRFTN